ncbi:MAG: phage portal protein [Bacillota bacterium]
MGLFEVGEYFPPVEQEDRIIRYRRNKDLIKSHHWEVFQQKQLLLNEDQKKILYLCSDLPALICKKSADFLFGETPVFTVGKDDKSKEQQRLDLMIKENKLHKNNYESALSNAYKGDSFYKIRWGQRYGGLVDAKLDPFRVFIETQKADYVFVELIPGSTEIYAYHIAVPTVVPSTGDEEWLLTVESHYPGKIVTTKYGMSILTTSKTDNEVTSWKIYKQFSDYEESPTKVGEPLIVHVPNFSIDDEWEGIDDISGNYTLFGEINNRLTQIANILNKHSDPLLIVPKEALVDDGTGQAVYNVEDKVFGMDGGEKLVKPEYVTWNGQLEYAFKQLEKAIDKVLINSEIPPVALGMSDSGTSGSSSLAIKFRMNSLLSKIRRKRMYYDEGLKKAFELAQKLEKANDPSLDYDDFDVYIAWQDGLPSDDKARADIISVRTGGKPTMSQKTALMTEYNLTEVQAELEMKRIREEEDAEFEVSNSLEKKQTTPLIQSDINSNPDKKGFEE